MFGAVGHGLSNLSRFSGRDSRAQFWPYAGFVFILAFVGVSLVMAPAALGSFARMQRFAAENPELATVHQSAGSYSIRIEGEHPELMPDMTLIFASMTVVFIATLLLLAAAVVRRLHDTGKAGWWGLMPVPFLIFGSVATLTLFSSFTDTGGPDMAVFGVLYFNNLMYLVVLVVLIVMLARRGTSVANRYGPA